MYGTGNMIGGPHDAFAMQDILCGVSYMRTLYACRHMVASRALLSIREKCFLLIRSRTAHESFGISMVQVLCASIDLVYKCRVFM